MAEHKHRPATYNEGGKKTVRCSGCFAVIKEVEAAPTAAPTPEPVEVEVKEPEQAAPVPEPVETEADSASSKRRAQRLG